MCRILLSSLWQAAIVAFGFTIFIIVPIGRCIMDAFHWTVADLCKIGAGGTIVSLCLMFFVFFVTQLRRKPPVEWHDYNPLRMTSTTDKP